MNTLSRAKEALTTAIQTCYPSTSGFQFTAVVSAAMALSTTAASSNNTTNNINVNTVPDTPQARFG